MSGHDWKVLASFGLLLGGLSLYDASFAVKLGGVALVVIVLRNADKIPLVGANPVKSAKPTAPAGAGSSTLQLS